MYGGIYAIFILSFIRGKAVVFFMRTLRADGPKQSLKRQSVSTAEQVSAAQTSETHYGNAVGLSLHSWTAEQALNLLSLLRGCMPPAGRFPPKGAANKLPERG